MKTWALNSLIVASILISGCATGPNSHDPLEPMNRKIYKFNETLDQIIVRPAAKAYTSFVPSLVRTGVRNVFTNLGVINTTFNDLLQLKIRNVPVGIARFTSNLISRGRRHVRCRVPRWVFHTTKKISDKHSDTGVSIAAPI